MKTLFQVIKNKYLIVLIAFSTLMLFFDRNDFFVQQERKRQLNELITSKEFYKKEIEKTKKELSNLQSSPAALEKYARENFLMKRDDEDIFIVEKQSGPDLEKK